MKVKPMRLLGVAVILTSTVSAALFLRKSPLVAQLTPEKPAENHGCTARPYLYKSEGHIVGLQDKPTGTSQEWPITFIPLVSQSSDPSLFTAVSMGKESEAAFYIQHNEKGEIEKVLRRSDISESVVTALYPMLTRFPLLRAELLDSDSYDSVSHDEFDFEAKGTLQQTEKGWEWEANSLKARPSVPGGVTLKAMTFQYHGYLGPAAWESIEGIQSLSYGLGDRSLAGSEHFAFTPEPSFSLEAAACAWPETAILENRYIPVDFQSIQKAAQNESQKAYFANNFDASKNLETARTLARTHTPGQESPRELLKALSDLSQYYHLFPEAQKTVIKAMNENIADREANPGEQLFLIDLVASFNSEESAEALFKLLQEKRLTSERLEAHVIASFNQFDKPSLDMYRYFLSEYRNENSPLDIRTTSLLAASSIAGHFEEASRETTEFLKSKLSDPKGNRDEKNLAVSALGNISTAESLDVLWNSAMGQDRELAEEAILGIGRSPDETAESMLERLLRESKLPAYKKTAAASSLLRRSKEATAEDDYRRKLDGLYLELVKKQEPEDLLVFFWNGTQLRGFVYDPELRKSHNRAVVDAIAQERTLLKWEKAL